MANNGAIASIVKQITDYNGAPCKKTLQKIVYLIEAKDISLGYDYGIHLYGPYSSDLDFAVRELCDEGVLAIDYTRTGHKIRVINDKDVTGSGDEKIDRIIKEIISAFGKETPSELELITTALYVSNYHNNEKEIIDGVKKIKGEKYEVDSICTAIKKLRQYGYLKNSIA
ncbi:MAG: hypothetical protein IKD89_07645 [Clostridia bacterium]|nr:hypothetical protein [Clostridia bacterium]